MIIFSLFVLKLVICKKNAVWSGVPAPAREVPGPWHFVEKMVTMFVRSKNVGGWSRCQDSRECAATKRGKIDVKTVYKIGKNMGWIILKRENPSVSRQCSTACFFFFCPSQKLLQFFLYVLKVVLCRKTWKLWFQVCLHRLERYDFFFPAVLTSSSAYGGLQKEYVFSLCPQICIL